VDTALYVADWFSRHLIIALPFIILAIKLVILRFAGEDMASAYRTLFALPLELVYAALAIALTALNNEFPAFVVKMGARSSKAAWILVLALIGLALLFTLIERLVRKLALNFLIVVRQIQDRIAGGFDWRLADFWVIGRLFWGLIYMVGITILGGFELAASVWTLVSVADLMV
jgi:hypothetical protein